MVMEDVAALYVAALCGDGGCSCSLWMMEDVAALCGDGGCSCSLW